VPIGPLPRFHCYCKKRLRGKALGYQVRKQSIHSLPTTQPSKLRLLPGRGTLLPG